MKLDVVPDYSLVILRQPWQWSLEDSSKSVPTGALNTLIWGLMWCLATLCNCNCSNSGKALGKSSEHLYGNVWQWFRKCLCFHSTNRCHVGLRLGFFAGQAHQSGSGLHGVWFVQSHIEIKRAHCQNVTTKIVTWHCPKCFWMLQHLKSISLEPKGAGTNIWEPAPSYMYSLEIADWFVTPEDRSALLWSPIVAGCTTPHSTALHLLM